MKRILFSCLVLALIQVGVARADPVLYGVTLTNLVTVNPNDPSQVSVVGPTGLAALGMVRPMSLAYHPGDGYLYGIGYDAPTGVDRTTQYLFRVDPQTGAGSIAAVLPEDPDVFKFMGIEYVETLSSLVVTSGLSSTQNQISLIDTNGATTLLATSNLVNNWVVFNSTSDVFFGVHMDNTSGTGSLARIDLPSGGATLVGPLPYPLSGDVAYNPADGFIYAATGPFPAQPTSYLYRIWTTSGGPPAGYDSVGPVGGDQLYAVAFAAAVPDPGGTWLLFSLGLTGLGYAWRKRQT